MDLCFWIAGASIAWALCSSCLMLWDQRPGATAKRIERRLDEIKKERTK